MSALASKLEEGESEREEVWEITPPSPLTPTYEGFWGITKYELLG